VGRDIAPRDITCITGVISNTVILHMAVMIRLYATILPFPVILRRRIKPEEARDLMGTRVHQGPTFTATTLDFTSSTLAARVWTPKEQSPASHLQTRDDRRQRLQVRVVPRDASAPGRRELYTSVHRAAECRESPCGVALRQESLDVEALCRYLALSSTS